MSTRFSTLLSEIKTTITRLVTTEKTDVERIAADDGRLRGNGIGPLSRSVLPAMTSALNKCQTQYQIQHTLATGFAELLGHVESEEFAKTIISKVQESFLDSPEFKDAVESIIEERELALEEQGRKSKKPRKSQDLELQLVTHYVFHYMCHRKFESPTNNKYKIESTVDKWPDPTPSGKDQITEKGVLIDVWRPDWQDSEDQRSKSFKAEAVAQISAELPEKDVSLVKAAVDVYFASSLKDYLKKRGDPNAVARETLRVFNQRTTQTQNALRDAFSGSPLAKCREQDLLWSAFSNNAWFLRFFKTSDSHGLRNDDQIGDEFLLFREIYTGELATPQEMWLVEDQSWWSDLFRLAYWVLYEASGRARSGQFVRTGVFHLPPSRWPAVRADTLPRVRPKSYNSGPAMSVEASPKTLWICQSMVKQEVLNDQTYDLVFNRLVYPDPPIPDEHQSLPRLVDMLQDDPTLMTLRTAVDKHLRQIQDVSDDELKRLWSVRSAGQLDQYRRDLASFRS